MKKKDFRKTFKSEEDCLLFLFDLKWKDGYCCKRCGNCTKWKGRTRFHARCTKCDYDESLTANTIFHKIQIPLLKAFWITYYVTNLTKGASCRNMAELLDIGLKTVWLFKRKIQEAMGACLSNDEDNCSEGKLTSVDGIILTRRGKGLNGLQQIWLSLKKFKSDVRRSTRKLRVSLKTDPSTFDQCTLVAGRYVQKQKYLLLWNFKVWLTGTHHHCSEKYLGGYFNEYCFKLNYGPSKSDIWEILIRWMVKSKPLT